MGQEQEYFISEQAQTYIDFINDRRQWLMLHVQVQWVRAQLEGCLQANTHWVPVQFRRKKTQQIASKHFTSYGIRMGRRILRERGSRAPQGTHQDKLMQLLIRPGTTIKGRANRDYDHLTGMTDSSSQTAWDRQVPDMGTEGRIQSPGFRVRQPLASRTWPTPSPPPTAGRGGLMGQVPLT